MNAYKYLFKEFQNLYLDRVTVVGWVYIVANLFAIPLGILFGIAARQIDLLADGVFFPVFSTAAMVMGVLLPVSATFFALTEKKNTKESLKAAYRELPALLMLSFVVSFIAAGFARSFDQSIPAPIPDVVGLFLAYIYFFSLIIRASERVGFGTALFRASAFARWNFVWLVVTFIPLVVTTFLLLSLNSYLAINQVAYGNLISSVAAFLVIELVVIYLFCVYKTAPNRERFPEILKGDWILLLIVLGHSFLGHWNVINEARYFLQAGGTPEALRAMFGL